MDCQMLIQTLMVCFFFFHVNLHWLINIVAVPLALKMKASEATSRYIVVNELESAEINQGT